MNIENFDWGVLNEYEGKPTLTKEHFIERIYNKFYEVNEGDIVVDVGASVGLFPYTIAEKNPLHVYCFEPSITEFPTLVKNTRNLRVTPINKAIGGGDGFTNESIPIYYSDGYYESMKFSTFRRLYAIDHINFLKTDCEGGEYHIFNPENIDFILNNVDIIVGEWHLGNPMEKLLFREFRDKYLPMFPQFFVYSVDSVDIKWNLKDDSFINYYNQVMIHIDNRK